jgi:hypothetical protein
MTDERSSDWWTPGGTRPGQSVVVEPATVPGGALRLTTTFVMQWVAAVVGVLGLVGAAMIGLTGGGWAMVVVVGLLGAAWLAAAAFVLPITVWSLRWDDSGISGRMCWPRSFFLPWDEIGHGRVIAPVSLISSSIIVLDTSGRRLRGTVRRRILVSDNMHRQLPAELWTLVGALETRRIRLDGRGLRQRPVLSRTDTQS